MKKLGFVAAALLLGSSLYANDFKVWAAPQYTFKSGTFNREVDYTSNGNKCAEQDYDEKFLSFIGADIGFAWRFISLEGLFEWGIPQACGSISQNGYSMSDPKICWDHKEFDNSFEAENFSLDTKLQFDIPVIEKWLNVRPYTGFAYQYAKFSGAFKSGRQSSIGDKYDVNLSSYTDKLAWDMFTMETTKSKDIWMKRELYDLKLGTMLHSDLFDRFFIDVDFATYPYSWSNIKRYSGSDYTLDVLKGLFRRWSVGAGAGVYLGKNKNFEIGMNFKFLWMNALKGDVYHSLSEKSNYEKYKDETVTRTESVLNETTGNYETKIYSEQKYGLESSATQNVWQLSIYGKYTFTFGPTHTPKVREPREKKARAPKVRKGKVEVRQY